jgi:hypothetical protein
MLITSKLKNQSSKPQIKNEKCGELTTDYLITTRGTRAIGEGADIIRGRIR